MATAWTKDSHFAADDSGGTLRTLTSYVTSVDGIPSPFEALDKTTFGAAARRVEAGLEGGTFTANFVWDNTATTGPDAVLAGARGKVGSVEFGPAGGTPTATTPVYRVEALLTDYRITGNVGQLIAASATWATDGAWTRAVA